MHAIMVLFINMIHNYMYAQELVRALKERQTRLYFITIIIIHIITIVQTSKLATW